MKKLIYFKFIFIGILLCCNAIGKQPDICSGTEFLELSQCLENRNWKQAEKTADILLQKYAVSLGEVSTNGLPLGYILEYSRGKALRRRIPLIKNFTGKRNQALKANIVLQNAVYWLYSVCKYTSCSGAWSDVFYEVGQTYKFLCRFGDAEDYLNSSIAFAGTNTQKQLRAKSALVALDVRRSWYKPAYKKMKKIWGKLKNPSREDYYLYSTALFSQRKDSEAANIMLDGLAQYGISPQLVERDPMFRGFLDHLGRLSDEDVAVFYDLLGLYLETIQLKRGNEELAALLINERNLLSRCYPFLVKKRDLEKLKTRCVFEATLEGEWEGLYDNQYDAEEQGIDEL